MRGGPRVRCCASTGLAEALAPLRDAVPVTDAASCPAASVVPCGDTSLALVLEA